MYSRAAIKRRVGYPTYVFISSTRRGSLGEGETHQTRNQPSQASARRAQDRTTQYMSHGVSSAGSHVLRALYEANRGKRKEATELVVCQSVSRALSFSRGSCNARYGPGHDVEHGCWFLCLLRMARSTDRMTPLLLIVPTLTNAQVSHTSSCGVA